MKRERSAKIK